MSVFLGFQEEIEKLAVLDKATKAWALSRGITSGVAAAIMGAGLMHAAKGGKKRKEENQSALRGLILPGLIGTGVGLGKGVVEKGLENKILMALSKARR